MKNLGLLKDYIAASSPDKNLIQLGGGEEVEVADLPVSCVKGSTRQDVKLVFGVQSLIDLANCATPERTNPRIFKVDKGGFGKEIPKDEIGNYIITLVSDPVEVTWIGVGD